MEKNTFDCDVGYFLDIDLFVRYVFKKIEYK